MYYNPNSEQIKIAFLAPSGFGKSTACQILNEEYDTVNIKLATPLYDIQKYYYQIIGCEDNEGKQDGELLQFLGKKIQKDHPDFLAITFFRRLVAVSKEKDVKIITNDDCRPHNYEALRKMGFKFVLINGYSRVRNDYTKADPNSEVEWRDAIPHDYTIDNMFGYSEYRKALIKLMGEIK